MINFYVLTDANLKIGQGHLARSLDLAKAAVILNYNVIIYINGDFANITSPLLEVHLNSDWYDKPESIEITDGVVLIDTYNNVDSLINKLLLSNNKVIKIIDDDGQYDSRLINLNPSLSKSSGLFPNYYVGEKYVIIRERIRSIKPAVSNVQSDDSILLFLGSNPDALLVEIIVKSVRSILGEKKELTLIALNFEIDSDNEYGKFTLLLNPDYKQLRKVLLTSDLIVTSLGQSLNEIVFLGKPFLGIMTAYNQINNFKYLSEHGHTVLNYLENPSEFQFSIDQALSNKYSSIALSSNNVLDGIGSYRFLTDSLEISNWTILRLADLSDSEYLYEIYSDEVVRQFSFNSDIVSFDKHLNWLTNKLNDVDSRIWLIINNGKRVGRISIDIESDEAVLNYAIDSTNRGKGLGTKTIELLIKELLLNYDYICKLIGFVKKENYASNHIFEKLGFKPEILTNMTKYVLELEK